MKRWWYSIRSVTEKWFTRHYTYPALDITLDGRYLHLVGTVHMGTQDMTPLPAALLRHLASADALLVEADITDARSPLSENSHPTTDLSGLTGAQQQMLQRRCNESGISPEACEERAPWQLALMLQAQQAWQLGLRPDYGIEHQLLQAIQRYGTPVIELEGADAQLQLLKHLPDNGVTLLQDTLEQWHANARLLQIMISWWLGSPPSSGNKSLSSTFSQELNNMLMQERNQRWCEKISQLPAGRYVIAVGALHLYCEENLPQLLQRKQKSAV